MFIVHVLLNLVSDKWAVICGRFQHLFLDQEILTMFLNSSDDKVVWSWKGKLPCSLQVAVAGSFKALLVSTVHGMQIGLE